MRQPKSIRSSTQIRAQLQQHPRTPELDKTLTKNVQTYIFEQKLYIRVKNSSEQSL